jgi:prolipoprotein diacylglyceryl transferase
MKPFLFTIGSVTIPSFFFMIGVGALLCTIYIAYLAPRYNLKRVVCIDMGIIGLISGVLGTRIFHILVEAPDYYWEKPMRVFEFWRGGFVSFGAYIGVPLALLVYFMLRKTDRQDLLEIGWRVSIGLDLMLILIWAWQLIQGTFNVILFCTYNIFLLLAYIYFKGPRIGRDDVPRYLDLVAIGTPIIQFSIRTACLLAGCCYGKPTDLPWALIFHDHNSTAYYFMKETALHPVQIYSGIHAVVLFIFINWFYRKKKTFPGQTALVMLILYLIPRAIIEFWRGDADRGLWFANTLSSGQIVGIVGVTLCIFLYRHLRKKASSI